MSTKLQGWEGISDDDLAAIMDAVNYEPPGRKLSDRILSELHWPGMDEGAAPPIDHPEYGDWAEAQADAYNAEQERKHEAALDAMDY